MTEAEWLQEQYHSQWMVISVCDVAKASRTKAGRRKLRLFACGCCRLLWTLIDDPRLREGVDLAEHFAEGQVSKEKLAEMHGAICGLNAVGFMADGLGMAERSARDMAIATTDVRPGDVAFAMTCYPTALAGMRIGAWDGESLICDLLRCVFGNPFRPMTIDRNWRTWNHGTVPKLAQAMYDERAFDRLPILADALEDAGCTEVELLAHCRGPGPHSRGCWVIDSLLK